MHSAQNPNICNCPLQPHGDADFLQSRDFWLLRKCLAYPLKPRRASLLLVKTQSQHVKLDKLQIYDRVTTGSITSVTISSDPREKASTGPQSRTRSARRLQDGCANGHQPLSFFILLVLVGRLSSRPPMAALLGKDAAGLSASAIDRLKDGWLDEHAAWQRRDLSAKRYVYIWADGIHLQARLEDEKQCILVLIGATPEGRKELVGFTDGARESAQDWRDLLLDLKRRGLDVAPRLVIADGALGFWKAAGEVWPKTREQRCWVHKTANVLAKLPKSQQPKAKRAL
jgi:hypothetical protein